LSGTLASTNVETFETLDPSTFLTSSLNLNYLPVSVERNRILCWKRLGRLVICYESTSVVMLPFAPSSLNNLNPVKGQPPSSLGMCQAKVSYVRETDTL